MGAVFYLGAGWPQLKPLDTVGTHFSLNIQKLQVSVSLMFLPHFDVFCDLQYRLEVT